MEQKVKSDCVDIYELKNGIYRHSIKPSTDTKLKLALNKNKNLPFVVCNQLLNHQYHRAKNNVYSVYHPVKILSPRRFQIEKQTGTKQINLCSKSILTAQTDTKNSCTSFSHTQDSTINKLRATSTVFQTPLKPHRIFNSGLKNSEPFKSQNLTQSRLMRLSVSKSNKIEIKTTQIPLGYEKPEFNSKLSRAQKSINESIELPEPQQKKEKINYVKKLITLFELKNSQSQDDLHQFVSGSCNQSHLSSFAEELEKVTQYKNFEQSWQKKQKANLSLISNANKENDNENQNSNLTEKDYKLKYMQEIPKEKIESSHQIKIQSLSMEQYADAKRKIQKEEDLYRSKQIRGLTKTGKRRQDHLKRQNQNNLQTPKFGKSIIFS